MLTWRTGAKASTLCLSVGLGVCVCLSAKEGQLIKLVMCLCIYDLLQSEKAQSHCCQKYKGKMYSYMYQHLQVNLLCQPANLLE